MPEIVERTGLTRSTLYRHLPPRPVDTHTAAGTVPLNRRDDVVGVIQPVEAVPPAASVNEAVWEPADERGILQSVTWPAGYRPPCPVCTEPTSGLKEHNARVGRELVVVAVAQPAGAVSTITPPRCNLERPTPRPRPTVPDDERGR